MGPSNRAEPDAPPSRAAASAPASLAAELDPAVPPLEFVDMPASPARLVEVRHALVAWAAAIGLPGELVEDIVLATYEGLINATEHAYTAEPRRLDLVAGLAADGWVVVTVRDYGRWRQPPADPGFRGRGLMMIHNLPDRAEVRPSADGTVVRMAWRWPFEGVGAQRVST